MGRACARVERDRAELLRAGPSVPKQLHLQLLNATFSLVESFVLTQMLASDWLLGATILECTGLGEISYDETPPPVEPPLLLCRAFAIFSEEDLRGERMTSSSTSPHI